MKGFLKILTFVLTILYPLIIFLLLWKFHVSSRILAFFLLTIATVFFLSNSSDIKQKGMKRLQFWGMATISVLLALMTFLTEDAGFVKLYPISMNVFLLLSFGSTLFIPPTMIFRFASLQDKTIEERPYIDKIRGYCRRVTVIWCLFFIINGSVSLMTALWGSDFLWTVYNGMISYILMGSLFAGEWIIRKRTEKKWSST